MKHCPGFTPERNSLVERIVSPSLSSAPRALGSPPHASQNTRLGNRLGHDRHLLHERWWEQPSSLCGAIGAVENGECGGRCGRRDTLTGDVAAAYRLPIRRPAAAGDCAGCTSSTAETRYQLVVAGADVLGGRVSVVRGCRRDSNRVIRGALVGAGAHLLGPASAADARENAAAPSPCAAHDTSTSSSTRATGAVLAVAPGVRHARSMGRRDNRQGSTTRFDGVAVGEGDGVKGDRKTIDTTKASMPGSSSRPDGRRCPATPKMARPTPAR